MFFVTKFDRDDFGDNSYQETHAGRYGVIPTSAEHSGGFGGPDPDAALILTTDPRYARNYAAHMKAAHDAFVKVHGEPSEEPFVNGELVKYQKTLAAAMEYARQHGEAYVTQEQAYEFAQKHELTDNEGAEFELWRSLIDDAHDASEDLDDDHYCFTVVTEDDVERQGEDLDGLEEDDRYYRVVFNGKDGAK